MKKAFIFHKDKMSAEQYQTACKFLKPLLAAGMVTMTEVPNKPAKAAKQINKTDYPEWFESLWNLLPNKMDKPGTLEAANNVIKQGYTVEDIIKGIPAYKKEEKRRSMGSDYRKHSPMRWIANHRFLDEQTENPRSSSGASKMSPEHKHWKQAFIDYTGNQPSMPWHLMHESTRLDIIEYINENKDKYK